VYFIFGTVTRVTNLLCIRSPWRILLAAMFGTLESLCLLHDLVALAVTSVRKKTTFGLKHQHMGSIKALCQQVPLMSRAEAVGRLQNFR